MQPTARAGRPASASASVPDFSDFGFDGVSANSQFLILNFELSTRESTVSVETRCPRRIVVGIGSRVFLGSTFFVVRASRSDELNAMVSVRARRPNHNFPRERGSRKRFRFHRDILPSRFPWIARLQPGRSRATRPSAGSSIHRTDEKPRASNSKLKTHNS